MRYVLNILAGLSQFWNVCLGGNRDQSLSSRAWEAKLAGRWYGPAWVAVINTMFFFEPDHCENAYLSDDERSY